MDCVCFHYSTRGGGEYLHSLDQEATVLKKQHGRPIYFISFKHNHLFSFSCPPFFLLMKRRSLGAWSRAACMELPIQGPTWPSLLEFNDIATILYHLLLCTLWCVWLRTCPWQYQIKNIQKIWTEGPPVRWGHLTFPSKLPKWQQVTFHCCQEMVIDWMGISSNGGLTLTRWKRCWLSLADLIKFFLSYYRNFKWLTLILKWYETTTWCWWQLTRMCRILYHRLP